LGSERTSQVGRRLEGSGNEGNAAREKKGKSEASAQTEEPSAKKFNNTLSQALREKKSRSFFPSFAFPGVGVTQNKNHVGGMFLKLN